jgi:hypothetical protein
MSSKNLKLRLPQNPTRSHSSRSTPVDEAAKAQAANPRGSGANRRDAILETGDLSILDRVHLSSKLEISRSAIRGTSLNAHLFPLHTSTPHYSSFIVSLAHSMYVYEITWPTASPCMIIMRNRKTPNCCHNSTWQAHSLVVQCCSSNNDKEMT